MANTKDYDPNKVTITVGGNIIEGFADSTFVTVSRNNQTWAVASGASGEHARAKSNDKTGNVELTLMQTSASNDILSAYMLLDESSANSGKFPFAISDANGNTLIAAVEMWVQQPPSVEYGKELGDRVWTLEAGDLEMFVGGTDVPA
jgi:hypothetical protein